MDNRTSIPTIADLALQYGTINKAQYRQAAHAYSNLQKTGRKAAFSDILQKLKMATGYQVGLLELIREYMIIRAKGEAFGKLAIEKGFATEADIRNALEHQRREFKRAKLKRLIGDILVETGVLTEKQKDAILKEQMFFETYGKQILAGQDDIHQRPLPEPVSEYERQFLEIKALDEEFGAIAVEKGYASVTDVRQARKIQEQSFHRAAESGSPPELRLIGDILVDQGVLSTSQYHRIMDEQGRMPLPENVPEIKIEIRNNNLEARVHLDKKSRVRVSLDDIKSALSRNGIVYGIYTDYIIQCFIDAGKTSFTAARQDFSLDLVKARRISYTFSTDGIDGQVKKKGQALAEQSLKIDGYLKKDLFGNILTAPSLDELRLRCGTGTRLSQDKTKVFASRTGYPSLSIEKKFYVHPVINILEDADLRYGPLEPFANLNVSGIITGAYPVKAGRLSANEIRGAVIEAIGDIDIDIGITDAVIRTQGSVKARYIHSSTIQAFGDVCVEFEIMDSRIACSGSVVGEKCRVISSEISAKKQVLLAAAGSAKTPPCTIRSGCEWHVVYESDLVEQKIAAIRLPVTTLEEKAEREKRISDNLFRKMVDLKIFHDKAKKKKEQIEKDVQQKISGSEITPDKKKNVARLIKNFESRMESAITALKELNVQKKSADSKAIKIRHRIEKILPAINRKIEALEMDRFSYFEWTRKEKNICRIDIKGKIFQGTVFNSPYDSFVADTDLKTVLLTENEEKKLTLMSVKNGQKISLYK